jgi:hypothetical protein
MQDLHLVVTVYTLSVDSAKDDEFEYTLASFLD